MRAGFWRRLAAAWVDAFVLYAIATFLSALAARMRVRVAFEPLYVVVGVIYSVLLLFYRGQTVGKMVLGIAVTKMGGGQLGLRDTLLREALGKWGCAIILPIALGRAIVGQAWVPTVCDFVVLIPGLLLLLVHYLFAKRTLYDLLAGTVAERAPNPSRLGLVVLVGVAVLGLGTKGIEYAARGRLPCRLALYQSTRSTAPYVAFLQRPQANPVDYIVGLFDQYDVVVLCERLHPEASQWEFILDLLGDPRFQTRVGHIFTEYGSVGMQDYLDKFMATDGLSPDEVHQRVVHLMRNFPVWPVWTNTNVCSYLTRLYELNQSLPPERRIHPYFTDVPSDWEGMTKERMPDHWRALWNRDEQMARQVIEGMDRLARSGTKRSKCLVVMNYSHAFDLRGGSAEARPGSTFEFLREAFGGRAANVLLNTEIVLVAPVAGGVWDAAFAEAGRGPAGLDFEGSPFGEDPFDMDPFTPSLKGRLKYRDVFTGLVYAQSLENQYTQHGVPGYYQGFEEEALRRASLVGEDYRHGIEYAIAQEKAGVTAQRSALSGKRIESFLEAALLAWFGIGLLIGIPPGIVAARARSEYDAAQPPA